MSVRLSGNFKYDLKVDLTRVLNIAASILSIVGSVVTLVVLWK